MDQRAGSCLAQHRCSFYLLHLYVLKLLYLACVALFGLNHGDYFGFDGITAVWLGAAALAVSLYLPVRGFARLKAAPPRHHLAEVLLKAFSPGGAMVYHAGRRFPPRN